MKMNNNEIRIIVEKITRNMIGAYGDELNELAKNYPNIKTLDLISITESVSSSLLANLLKFSYEKSASKIDMKVTLDRLHESLKFHLLDS